LLSEGAVRKLVLNDENWHSGGFCGRIAFRVTAFSLPFRPNDTAMEAERRDNQGRSATSFGLNGIAIRA